MLLAGCGKAGADVAPSAGSAAAAGDGITADAPALLGGVAVLAKSVAVARAPQLVQKSAPGSRVPWQLLQRGASGTLGSEAGELAAWTTSLRPSAAVLSGKRMPQAVQKTATASTAALHLGQVVFEKSVMA